MMLSFHCDTDKTARRAALAEVLIPVGKQTNRKVRENGVDKWDERETDEKINGAAEWAGEENKTYKPCVEICLSSNLL